MGRHNERCRSCKDGVERMLSAVFGPIVRNHDLNLPCRLEDLADQTEFNVLARVHAALQAHRGFRHFVRARRLPRVDYFVPGSSLIVEFDESQHFTRPRGIALHHYPEDDGFGFPVGRWRALCDSLDKRDPQPPYRDEQRAWYDTLRDFAPRILGSGRTVCLYSRDLVWCSLDPAQEADRHTFMGVIATSSE